MHRTENPSPLRRALAAITFLLLLGALVPCAAPARAQGLTRLYCLGNAYPQYSDCRIMPVGSAQTRVLCMWHGANAQPMRQWICTPAVPTGTSPTGAAQCVLAGEERAVPLGAGNGDLCHRLCGECPPDLWSDQPPGGPNTY